ncbi:hypothetical protein GGR52DRAFT_524821 [Hypoxylon sp. FL1284]|nr:hypothetical protein GGR52DRAFT_524821 [Hypoxylon sp. FL1284]
MSLTPPVSKDGFAYAGELYAEASGHNRHRRATVSELKDHFKSGSERDHPAHWFEAQLLHYGLQPSKTKAVARMRLYDAVNGGKLVIPAHVKKIESELKKSWTKNDRDAKKALKTDPPAVKSAKRKAESKNVDLTVNVGGINITVSAASSAKKAKTTSKPAAPSKAAKKTPEPKPKAPKAPKPAAKPKTTPSSTAKPKPKPKAVSEPKVKREPSFAPFSSSSAVAAAAATPTRPRTVQTARRSHGWNRGRTPGPPSSSYARLGDLDDDDDDDNDDGEDDSPPPPYFKVEDSDSDTYGGDPELQPLGLLNGRYDVASADVTSQWSQHSDEDFSLVLTLSGSELWGRLDLGVVEAVLRLPQRPYQPAADERLRLRWRGRELEGPMLYGDDNTGHLRFLGGGRVDGCIDFLGGLRFRARRVPGQGTRSEADARDLRREWDGYNEREYDRENRGRWG